MECGRQSRWVVWCALFLASGCAVDELSPDASAPDASVDASGMEGWAFPVEPPTLPSPPNMSPCAEGFREQTLPEGPVVCEPWPEGGRRDCPEGEAHFVGEPGCRTVGSPCPEGEFPEDLPSGAPVLYVRAGAAGDGTMAAPFGSITEAVARANDGHIVAIARGTYDEAVELTEDVTLWGACAEDTVLRWGSPDAPAVVRVRDASVTLRNLRVGRSECRGVQQSGGALSLESVIIEQTRLAGFAADDGGELLARDIVVRDTRPGTDGTEGYGLVASGSASIEVERAVLARNYGIAALADGDGAAVTMRRVAIFGTVVGERTSPADLFAQRGATLTVTHGELETRGVGGAFGLHPGTRLELDGVIARAAGPEAQGLAPSVLVLEGAASVVRRSVLHGHTGFGVMGSGSVAAVSDVVIRTAPSQPGALGLLLPARTQSILASGGGTLELHRAHVSGHEQGLHVMHPGTAATLEDVAFADPVHPESIPLGSGVSVTGGAHVQAARISVAGALRYAVALGAGVTGRVDDLTITGTRTLQLGEPEGIAVFATLTGQVAGRRWSIADSETVGILLDGARLDLEHVFVDGVDSSPDTGELGLGILAQHGAVLDLAHARVRDVRSSGVAAVASVIRASGMEIRTVEPPRCADDGACEQEGHGVGIAAHTFSAVWVDRFTVDRAALCGVYVSNLSTLELSSGEVRNGAIGACVQADGYDTERISRDVRYVDNGRPLDSVDLPVPLALGSEVGEAPVERAYLMTFLEYPCRESSEYTLLGPSPGESGHRLAVRLTPPKYPYEIDHIHYTLATDGPCLNHLAHRVEVWTERGDGLSSVPEVMAAIDVPEIPPPAEPIRDVNLTLDAPLTVREGEDIIVALQLHRLGDLALCALSCAGLGIPDRKLWSNATEPPYAWTALGWDSAGNPVIGVSGR